MLPPSHDRVVEALLDALQHSGVVWVLTGSAGFALQGVPVQPRDVDVQTDEKGAYAIEGILKARFPRSVVDPVGMREAPLVRSHLGRMDILGLRVEIMGDIQKRKPDSPWEPPLDLKSLRTFVPWRSWSVPVLPIAYEREAYLRLGRSERAEALGRFLEKPKVYVTRRLPPEAIDVLSPLLRVNIWPEEETVVPRERLLAEVADAHAVLCLLTERIDEELLNHSPRLKIAANMAAGYDNIDVPACTRRRVLVTNTPGVLTESTADLAFALLLATARRIPESRDVLLQNRWRTWSPMFLAGQDVHGATLGIVGLGRIGQAVARRARGFGMTVTYYSRNRYPDSEQELGVQYSPLDDLLGESDFVSVHLPLTAETRHFIGSRELSLMKPSAVLINTSRGPVVDEKALYEALWNRRIWAAGLDVFEQEPLPPDSPLRALDNVVLLPHIGSASIKTRTSMAVMAATNIRDYLFSGKPLTPVNAL
jgi:glyoxylate reductase